MIGKKISHYSVTEKLGAGGMSEVYRAEDTWLSWAKALTFLPEVFSFDRHVVQWFSEKAARPPALNHALSLLLAVVWILLPVLPLAAQQEFPGEVARWRVIRPKPGMELQFEEAYRRHVKEWGYTEFGDGRLLLTWQIVTGERVGQYVVATVAERWEDLDARPEGAAGAGDDFYSNVYPYVKSLSSSITVQHSDISRVHTLFYAEPLVEVIRFHLRFGTEGDFTYVQRKIREAIEKTVYSIRYKWWDQWHQLVSGGEQPTFILIRAHSRLADLEPPEKSVESILEDVYGREETSSLMRRFGRSVKKAQNAIWFFRYDLSYQPTSAQPGPRPPLEVMPQFPWPPPRWTSRYVLPKGLVVTGEADTLGILFDRITKGLIRGKIYEWSAYGVGNDGFAIVSRMEQIADDGRPKPGAKRWAVQRRLHERPVSLAEYIRALFLARPGRYRVIVLIVTTRPIRPSEEEPEPSAMERLLREGAGVLPKMLRTKILGPSGRCEALIYEFYRASEDEDPHWVNSSHLLAIDHLTAAGLWRKEELLP